MGKRKRNQMTLQDLLDRPWCYYCERDFDDVSVLMEHMKAKHLRCLSCHRRLYTAGGLSVHMQQVHKEQLTTIEEANPDRTDPNIEVFAMQGIPQDLLDAHRNRITNEYWKMQAERRALTGNPPPGTQTEANKRSKIESKEDLKARVAAAKAKRLADKLAAESGVTVGSGGNTPSATNDQDDDDRTRSPVPVQATAGSPSHYQQPYGQGAQHRPHTQPDFAPGPFHPQGQFQPPPATYPPHSVAYPPPPSYPPAAFSPPVNPYRGLHNYPAPVLPGYHAPNTANTGYHPTQALPSPVYSSAQGFTPLHASAPAQPETQHVADHESAKLSPATGTLPARPASHMPRPSKEDLAKMHAGHAVLNAVPGSYNQHAAPNESVTARPRREMSDDAVQDRIDSLLLRNTPIPPKPEKNLHKLKNEHDEMTAMERKSILVPSETMENYVNNHASDTPAPNMLTALNGAMDSPKSPLPEPVPASTLKNSTPVPVMASAVMPATPATPDTPVFEQQAERRKKKKSKDKDADKDAMLVYPDEIISPEEKKASRPRYAFKRDDTTEYTLDHPSGAVAGTVD